ncbi:hypothetical protein RJT34_13090 [Clitoria ternatea]|uniref:Uncharacterized protein n=1 Tax=Clitoria ternatea TaxID=43366 RepID=A0AAN9PM01_CLITE
MKIFTDSCHCLEVAASSGRGRLWEVAAAGGRLFGGGSNWWEAVAGGSKLLQVAASCCRWQQLVVAGGQGRVAGGQPAMGVVLGEWVNREVKGDEAAERRRKKWGIRNFWMHHAGAAATSRNPQRRDRAATATISPISATRTVKAPSHHCSAPRQRAAIAATTVAIDETWWK